MATLTYRTQTLPSIAIAAPFKQYNKFAIVSLLLASLFVLYFLLPHGGVFAPVFNLSVLYILIVPAVAMVTSVLAIRQMHQTHERGHMMTYFALGITTLYFMVALAIPLVLVGLYIIYSFIL